MEDLRFALASLRRRPLIAIAVILTLGLGIGANAAIFRAFHAAFLRPLPFANEERLVRIYLASPGNTTGLSPRADVFLALREHNRNFAAVVGQRFNDFTLLMNGEPQRIRGIEVSEGWTRVLGVAPQLGRTFTADEERRGSGAGVVLISDSTWRTRFGASPAVLGRAITLNSRPFTIIGVMPPGVRFPYESEVWVPTRFDANLESTWALHIVARLRDGVTHAAVANELKQLTAQLPEVRAQQGLNLSAVPLRETLVDDGAPVLFAVSIAVAFLLLLVTVNVANLLAAHSLSRRREFAIRTALGAGLGRHLRQTMTEGLVLATAGGALGLAIAWASTSFLAFLVPENFAYVFERVPFDPNVLLFTGAIVIVTGVVFGAIPVLRIARKDPQPLLVGGGRTTEQRSAMRGASLMTAAQLALALVLLAGAHALMSDVARRASHDLGYDQRNLLTASIVLPADRYPGADERNRFYEELSTALANMPGVDAAGTVNLFPAAGQGALIARVEGEGVEYRADAPLLAHNRMIDGDLFRAMGLRIVRGRAINADEIRRGAPVAVISRELATTLWPNADPIGKRIRNRRIEDAEWLQVVGLVDDLEEFYADTSRAMWQPVRLYTAQASTAQASIVLRSSTPTESLAAALRATVRRIDPTLAVFEIATAEELYRNSLAGRESARTLTAAFAMLGLLVAAIGVYASMAFAMTRRTRELAVRMAIGATRTTLSLQFLGRSAALILISLAAGTAATFGLMRLSFVGEIAVSFASLAVPAALLAFVALLASWLPLRRALRVEPTAILRAE